ncbi:MAG: hypothetical protein GQ565_03065 [Candidatus Aegiribacteria sp.]|nr:hypothetical protein [Candidatus Aegiribacteria sp.]
MKEHNGHRSWNAWNVALWIGSDEHIYRFAMECINRPRTDGRRCYPRLAIDRFMRAYGGTRTPDGATYNQSSVSLALAGLAE